MGRRSVILLAKFLGILLIVSTSKAGQQVCVDGPADLATQSELSVLKDYFPASTKVGYINETAGSYFEVEAAPGTIEGERETYSLTFYTSGLLDLFGVVRSGPAKFCVIESRMTVQSMGQMQSIRVVEGKIVLGEGGPRKTFSRGEMPPKLVRLHRPPGTAGTRTQEKGFANPSQREEQ